MTSESEPTPSLEERLQTVREGIKLMAEAARPSVAESLKLARDALRSLDGAMASGLRMVERTPGIAGLYVIVDPAFCKDRDPVLVAEQALRGGASIIQWRDKRRDKGEQLTELRALQQLCDRYVALLIVNDHIDLAIAVDASGVHVGQHDLPVAAVRKMAPVGFVVGCSTNNPDEARQAQADGANYVAVGRVFASSTKANTRDASPATVTAVKGAISIPVVAIGGITAANVDEVIAAGADAAAIITAVCEAPDVEEAALVISKRFEMAAERARAASDGGHHV
jgi:thiamine-phosphate pyrophosphorylase